MVVDTCMRNCMLAIFSAEFPSSDFLVSMYIDFLTFLFTGSAAVDDLS